MARTKRRIRNTQIRGFVFGLSQVSFSQSVAGSSYDLGTTNSWSEADYYSYFAGGAGAAAPLPTSGTCSVYRLDLSNETISAPPANQLGRAYYGMTGVTGPLYGYFMGGASPIVGTIKRIDYLTETVTTPATICPNQNNAAALQDTNDSFIGGGNNQSTVNKFDPSVDTITPTGGVVGGGSLIFGQPRTYHSGASSAAYGYFIGGFGQEYFPTPLGPVLSPSPVNGFSIWDLKTSTLSVGEKNGGIGGLGGSACQTNSYAYHNQQQCIRFDFYNDSRTPLSNLASGPLEARGAGSNNIFGYFVGGITEPPTPTTTGVFTSKVDRLNFSTNTSSVVGNYNGGAVKWIGSISVGGRKTKIRWQPQVSLGYGYVFGGATPGLTSIVDRLSFTNETNVFISTRTPSAISRNQATASYPTGNYIYYAGGTPAITCNIQRLDFSVDSFSTPASKLPVARFGMFGTYDAGDAYFGGGYFTPPVTWSCTIVRMVFSTDTVSLPGKNLPTGTLEAGSFQSPTVGYILGGDTPANYVCTIHKLDFSTDTISQPGKNITIASSKGAGVESTNYGYLNGGEKVGSPPIPGFISVTFNTVHRLEFATETITAPVTYPRTYGIRGGGGVSAASNGYFLGGVTNPPGGSAYVSDVTRMSFSTETITLTPTKLTRNNYTFASASTVK